MPVPDTTEPTVEIVVRLSGRAAADDVAVRRTVEDQALVEPAPLHPGTSDSELARFAITRVAQSAAETVVDRLVRCVEVDAAYTKPESSPS
jgi:hypothetical protein